MRDVLSRAARIALVSLAVMTVAVGWAGIASAAAPAAGTVGPAPAPPFTTWAGQFYAAGIVPDPTLCPSGTGPLGDPGNVICDHYRLTVAGGGPVQVRIDWATPDNDFDLYVFQCPSVPTAACDVAQVAASAEAGTTFESVNFPATGGTTYEVRVIPFFVIASDYRGCAAFTARATCTSAGGMVNSHGIDPPISISDARVTEGDSGTKQATFAVALGSTTISPVTVNYVTKNRTATAGSDYLPQSGTIVIPAGQTSATVSIPVIGDVENEDNEVFEVDLVLPSPAVVVAKIEDGQGFGKIYDDDWLRMVSGSGNVGLLSSGTFTLWAAENRSGKLSYRDSSTRFYAYRITAASFTDATRSARIDGTGWNNGHSVTFTLEVADGLLDTFVLTLSDGTRISGPLSSGNISYTG